MLKSFVQTFNFGLLKIIENTKCGVHGVTTFYDVIRHGSITRCIRKCC